MTWFLLQYLEYWITVLEDFLTETIIKKTLGGWTGCYAQLAVKIRLEFWPPLHFCYPGRCDKVTSVRAGNDLPKLRNANWLNAKISLFYYETNSSPWSSEAETFCGYKQWVKFKFIDIPRNLWPSKMKCTYITNQ